MEHPALDETLIAGCATYKAFNRFLTGKDLFILPTTRDELVNVLYVNHFITLCGLEIQLAAITSVGTDTPRIQSTTPSPERATLFKRAAIPE